MEEVNFSASQSKLRDFFTNQQPEELTQ
jgi:hypothetical protein